MYFTKFPMKLQKCSQGFRAVTASKGSFALSGYESWVGKETLPLPAMLVLE